MKTYSKIACVLFALAAGCGGGGGGGRQTCTALGGACTLTAECCAGICINSICGGGSNPDSAISTNPDLSTTTSCAQAGGACTVAGDCCNGASCTNNICVASQSRKAFGAPCTQASDCNTNECLTTPGYSGGFCSTACTSGGDVTCANASANPEYWCAAGAGNIDYCLRNCTMASDCADIGSDWSCRQNPDVENQVFGMCGVYKNQPIGYPCLDDSQCASGSCSNAWCWAPCANNAACGQYATCVLNTDQSYRCYAACTMDSDCTIYDANLTCKATTSRDGTTVMVCSS